VDVGIAEGLDCATVDWAISQGNESLLYPYFSDRPLELKKVSLASVTRERREEREGYAGCLAGLATSLDEAWQSLARSTPPPIPGFYSSLLPLPEPFVVPGGRFREQYYWDTYFTMRGLVASGYVDLARGMLSNFLRLMNEYGFIPNGNRRYYLDRSQPPLFSAMVQLLGAQVNETYRRAVAREYAYWTTPQRTVATCGSLTHYWSNTSNVPRLEAYLEDMAKPARTWRDIRAGAESGWDFTERWMTTDGTFETTHVIPVELQVYLMNVEDFLGLHDAKAARAAALDRLAFNATLGRWVDLDARNCTQRWTRPASASSYFPLAATNWTSPNTKAAIASLKASPLLSYEGGVPATLYRQTGQQWDFPNVWAPIQLFLIDGLHAHGHPDTARSLAAKFLKAVAKSNPNFYEKYDARESGAHGAGGEYTVQKGFGWTNGVALDLLTRYNDLSMATSVCPSLPSPPLPSPARYTVLAVGILAVAALIFFVRRWHLAYKGAQVYIQV
jgi:alpha,alpha-trehalase